MPRIECLAFYFVAFWVCFFGGWAGVSVKHECRTTDAQYTVNQNNNTRISNHTAELMSLRSEVKQEAIDQHKHHMYHLTSHCKVVDRCVELECRVKRLEQRMVIVVPQEMPPPVRLMDPRELDPNPNIPPQKLPITPKELP